MIFILAQDSLANSVVFHARIFRAHTQVFVRFGSLVLTDCRRAKFETSTLHVLNYSYTFTHKYLVDTCSFTLFLNLSSIFSHSFN